MAMVKILGMEWCKPEQIKHESGKLFLKEYIGNVAMHTNIGYILLCEVTQDIETGEISRRPIKEDELNIVKL